MEDAPRGPVPPAGEETRAVAPVRTRAAPWLTVWRPASAWEVLGHHLPGALGAGLALFATWLVPPARIPLRVCTFLNLTGYPCPFCGTTRTFHLAGHGRWEEAAATHPAALALYFLFWAVFLWNAGAILARRRVAPGPRLRPDARAWRRIGAAAAAAWLAVWAYRLATGQR